MFKNRLGYFQGTEEPTPKKKKYKSEPLLIDQTRFKEPFYHNYDLYDVKGFEHIGPGTGYNCLHDFKSVKDFLNHKRKKQKDKYKPDDSWKLDDGSITKHNPIKARKILFNRLMKLAIDLNYIDFPIDDQIGSGSILGNSDVYDSAAPIGGMLDEYLPLKDFEGKSPVELDFGRDYNEDGSKEDFNINKLVQKYLNPAEPSLYGLPDGILPQEDLDAPDIDNPQYGTTDSGNMTYDN